jgi:hypothetical protein
VRIKQDCIELIIQKKAKYVAISALPASQLIETTGKM